MRYVTGVDSVHTAASVCDYLQERLSENDELVVVAVDEDGSRDAADAANVVQARLLEGTIRIEPRDGDPGAEIRDVAAAEDAAEVVIGAHRGAPGCGPAVGDTARRLLRELDRPVVVVPVPELAPE